MTTLHAQVMSLGGAPIFRRPDVAADVVARLDRYETLEVTRGDAPPSWYAVLRAGAVVGYVTAWRLAVHAPQAVAQ